MISWLRLLVTVIVAISCTATLAQHSAHESNDDRNAMRGFKTPSGNIHCQIQDWDSPSYLRCDILKTEGRVPPKPRDCEFDWGQAFSVDQRRAQRMCYSDTVMDESLQTLPYGSTWRRAGFTCVSEPSGLSCSNRFGRGFQLSRSAQRLF
jgi:hypothetical protein